MVDIVGIGECMIEFARTRDGGWQQNFAGDVANTLIYLSRLGRSTAIVTATGADSFSHAMRAFWTNEGVDVSLALTDPDRRPGLYAIDTDRLGERTFHYWRGQSAARTMFELAGADAVLDGAAQASLIFVSGITLAVLTPPSRERLFAWLAEQRQARRAIAFDPNYRPSLWTNPAEARAAMRRMTAIATIVLPSWDDERALWNDATPDAALDRWIGGGASEAALKLGPRGCRVAKADGLRADVAQDAHVIATDTTGAGDAFNAGYLAKRWLDADPVSAAGFANRLAAATVRFSGAIMPTAAMPVLTAAAETHGDGA